MRHTHEVCSQHTLALLLTALTAVGCSESDTDEADPAAAAATRPIATVVVADVEVDTIPIIREFVARTEAVETVAVQARVEAILESKHFEEGRRVEKD